MKKQPPNKPNPVPILWKRAETSKPAGAGDEGAILVENLNAVVGCYKHCRDDEQTAKNAGRRRAHRPQLPDVLFLVRYSRSDKRAHAQRQKKAAHSGNTSCGLILLKSVEVHFQTLRRRLGTQHNRSWPK